MTMFQTVTSQIIVLKRGMDDQLHIGYSKFISSNEVKSGE